VKGVIIANCGGLGLNWERLSLSGYLETLNAKTDPGDQPSAEPTPRLKRFMAAHGKADNA
jgi:hypothetical protein